MRLDSKGIDAQFRFTVLKSYGVISNCIKCSLLMLLLFMQQTFFKTWQHAMFRKSILAPFLRQIYSGVEQYYPEWCELVSVKVVGRLIPGAGVRGGISLHPYTGPVLSSMI